MKLCYAQVQAAVAAGQAVEEDDAVDEGVEDEQE